MAPHTAVSADGWVDSGVSRFPLSASRLDGDKVVCGYHGFTYDTTGTCVYVPGQKRVPRTARASSYPVVEQDSFVRVGIGDSALADATTIPGRRTWPTARSGRPSVAWSRSTATTGYWWTT
jgi:vanillate O-demethylase monooxygenase subunit